MEPRSYLFVPGHRPERFAKALASGADAVILDLEDAVDVEHKAMARDQVLQFLASADAAWRQRLLVRINDDSTPWFQDDLARLAQCPGLTLMLPKAERADTVAALRRACPGSPVLALIESARGVLAAERLAQCDGVARLAFGTIDFALDLDLPDDPIGLDAAGSLLALASRAAGLPPPVAGVTADINDETRLLADLARARALGFGAKMCIHPKQVAPLHAAMQPTAVQLDWARRVLAAADSAQGAVQLDGRMVDAPVIAQARRLLARATPG
jgi:citrate lyase subunit beta/citryl-CoA lyase